MKALIRQATVAALPAILAGTLLAPTSVALAKKPAPAKVQQASEQTQRAISELAGKFKWGMSPDEVSKIVIDDINARFEERIRKEPAAARQDAIRAEQAAAIEKFTKSFIKFDGQKTGWDVSIVDREYAHKNSESMMVIWEKDQRRFLFFYRDMLWKQFIAFNAENPAFQGKTFDDFANLIQQRYGQASMTFRKARTSEDQQLDHLEWPASGDYVLWAIDLTQFYGNFCLSLWQRTKVAELEDGRRMNSPERRNSGVAVDDVLKNSGGKADDNADIIDRITGRDTSLDAEEKAPAASSGKGGKHGGKATATASPSSTPSKSSRRVNPRDEDKDKVEKAADPLEGTGL